MRGAAHQLREALRQRRQRVGLGDEGAHLVQRRKALALHLQPPCLLGHARLQLLVQRLQVRGHGVEGTGQLPELVLRDHFHPGGEVVLADAGHGALQPFQRLQHEEVAGVEEGHGAGDRQTHQHQLHAAQQGRSVGQALLDLAHEAVDAVDQRVHLRQRRRGGPARPCRPQRLPARAHVGKALAGVGVPGHEERARWVARAQPLQAGVQRLGGGLLCRAVGRGERQRQPVALHAHAPGFVHRRGAAFELPRHPQRERDRAQRQHEESAADRVQFGGQRPAQGRHGATVGSSARLRLEVRQAPSARRRRAGTSSSRIA